jgi:hypothetical protein
MENSVGIKTRLLRIPNNTVRADKRPSVLLNDSKRYSSAVSKYIRSRLPR